MLLACNTGQRLEPMGEVCCAFLECPLLHSVGNFVGDIEVEGLAALDDLHELAIGRLGQALLHVSFVEEQLAPLGADLVLCHGVSFPRGEASFSC